MPNSHPFQPQYAGVGFGSKVAIPRLERREESNPASKVKCTGEIPRCENCEKNDLTCTYEQARKDRLKTATQQNRVLISLLKELKLRVDEEDKKKIDATLDAVEEEVANPAASTSTKALGIRGSKDSSSDEEHGEHCDSGEAHAPASVGSNEDLALLDEDLLRSREARQTGFVGQNSEVQWLRSLQRRMRSIDGEGFEGPYGPPGASSETAAQRASAMHERRNVEKIQYAADSSFYLDGDSIEVEAMVDPFEIPPSETAERLFACYMETVHSWFPILPQGFEGEFRKYYESINFQRRFQVPEKWQTVLNLVFAIGARYSHLTRASWRADEHDHLLYMTRAVRILGVRDMMMIISTPDLSLIQATGLLSFYYMVIGHVSRAWVMVGISLRSALAVGLHLRNEDPSTSLDKKDTLARTWWSLRSVECLVSAITGRPCIIPNEDCTVPVPSQEEHFHHSTSSQVHSNTRNDYPKTSGPSQTMRSDTYTSSNSTVTPPITESFPNAHIKISLTTRSVLESLYSAHIANASWECIQRVITSLMRELDEWAAVALPGGSNSPNLDLTPDAQRERLLLEFHYNSTKLLITRPCLCRLDRRIKSQSDDSINFNQRTAEACVQAAQSLTHLFPDQPDPVYIYQKGPWWSIVHYIMQAMAILLLEMSYEGPHMTTQDSKDIPKSIKKLVRWLQSMRRDNGAADRAYNVVIEIVKSGKLRVQDNITDILAEEEEDIELGYLLQDYPMSTHASDSGNADARSAWQADYYPDSTGNFDPMFDPFVLPGQFQMAEMYGNPFLTNFDQSNPFSLTTDELLMDEGEVALQYSQSQGQYNDSR